MTRRNPRAKWTLPEVIDPTDTICFKVNVPNEIHHIGAFMGAIYMLSSAIFWQDDTEHTAKEVAKVWQRIFDELKASDCGEPQSNITGAFVDSMPFFRQVCENDICYLEFECCPGEWVRLGRADQIPAGSQSGGGSPQPKPGGGNQQYCQTLQANSKMLLPTVVNTGDVITLQSASGAGNDGGVTTWYCPDGSQFFAGQCLVTGKGHGTGDPSSSAYHMALILNINGAWYDLSSPVTVPSGVSSQQAFIQVNDSDITNNSGSYQVCVNVQNNQSAAWSKTFDFTASPSGWSANSLGFGALWSASDGWSNDPTLNGGLDAQIHIVIPSTEITQIQLQYASNGGCLGSGSAASIYQNAYTLPARIAQQNVTAPTGLLIWSGDSNFTEIFLGLNGDGTGGCTLPALALRITGCIISGKGTNPFA